jgi:flagellar motor switch/type III secretory pathway protein FliN
MVNEKITATNAGRRGFAWIQPLLVVCAVSILALGLGLYSTRSSLHQRVAELEANLDATTLELTNFRTSSEGQAKELVTNVDLLTSRLGVTADDLQKARTQLAQRMKQQQEQVEQKLATELAVKANSTDVDSLRQESATKLAEVQQEANTKVGTVSNEVVVVKNDLATARRDMSRELTDVKNALSDGIARNATELAQLRQKGEREYIELDIKKNQKFQRVGDIQIAVSKTDAKKGKYSVMIQADDSQLEKKDRTTNEPVQFLVGRDQLRYELVINAVAKDQIRGYLSTPKNRVLSAEGPTLRQ